MDVFWHDVKAVEKWLEDKHCASFKDLEYEHRDAIYLLNGKPFTGVVVEWNENGLNFAGQWKNGLPHGIAVEYGINKKILEYAEFKRGIRCGAYIEFDNDGNEIKREHYKVPEDEPVESTEELYFPTEPFDPTKLTVENFWQDVEAVEQWLEQQVAAPDEMLHFDESNGLTLVQGKPFTGASVQRDDEGQITWMSLWNEGEMHGASVFYSPDGQLMLYEQYRQGARHGELIEWDIEGNVVHRDFFERPY